MGDIIVHITVITTIGLIIMGTDTTTLPTIGPIIGLTIIRPITIHGDRPFISVSRACL